MKAAAFRIRLPLLALILVTWFAWPAAEHATGLERPASRPSTRSAAKSSVDLLVLSEDDARLIPPVVALAGRLSGARHVPALLISTGSVHQRAEDLFLRQLQPRRCVVLRTGGVRSPIGDRRKTEDTVIELGESLTQASLEIAGRFQGTTKEVVLVRATEPSAMILASALAAHMKAPLIPVEDGTDHKALRSRLGKIKGRQLLAVTARGAAGTLWLGELLPDSEVLDVRQAAERLVRTIGPKQVRNIIVARCRTLRSSRRRQLPWRRFCPLLARRRSSCAGRQTASKLRPRCSRSSRPTV